MNYFSIYSLSRGISQSTYLLPWTFPSFDERAPLPEETRGFSFVVRILPEKQHPNHFSICGKGWKDNQLILNRLGSEWGWNRQLHTHLPQKWWCREPAGGFFFLPCPPSVKINKITIKKIPCCDKSRLSHRLFRKAQEERGSQLYQKWELIFDWINGGKNCFKGNGWRFVCIKMKIRGIVCNQS